MFASPAIKGRVAAVQWRPLLRLITVVYGLGQSVTVRTKGRATAKIGDDVFLIDSESGPWFSGRRFYIDFTKHGLEDPGSYGVWVGGLSRSQVESGDFECLSAMVDDWFTFVDDDAALTLLCVTNGDGHFRIGRDHLTLV